MAEHRRQVAVAVEHRREHDERQRERRLQRHRTRLERHPQWDHRRDQERPAEQVVQERRACEVPRVLLVHDERGAGDDERERHRQPPPSRLQPAVHETELGAAREHQHLGPRAVRVHVDRGVGEERHHRPHHDAHPERDPGPQVLPPPSRVPDLAADDRLGQETQAQEEQGAGEQPVDHLCRRFHQASRSARSASSGRATTSAKTTPTTATSSGGSISSHQTPWCNGCSSVSRYGWTIAQTAPAATAAGPSSEITNARLVRACSAGSERA